MRLCVCCATVLLWTSSSHGFVFEASARRVGPWLSSQTEASEVTPTSPPPEKASPQAREKSLPAPTEFEQFPGASSQELKDRNELYGTLDNGIVLDDYRLVLSPEQERCENAGRLALSAAQKARQKADLDKLGARWQRLAELKTWEETRLTGWSTEAEIINGRAAMFFIVVGLLTEYWTGQSIPEQVLTMARITGFVEL